MVTVKSDTFVDEIENSSVPVFVIFSSKWCQPCKMLKSLLVSVEEKYTNKIKFVTIDVQESCTTANKYRIMSVPTVLIFNKGKMVANSTGLKHKEEYHKLIADVIK